VKFFTRKRAVLDEEFVPLALLGGSPGGEGCSRERSGRVSGRVKTGVAPTRSRDSRGGGAAAHAVLTTVRTVRGSPVAT